MNLVTINGPLGVGKTSIANAMTEFRGCGHYRVVSCGDLMDEIISDSGYPDIETAIIGLRGSDNTIDHQLDAKIAELVNNHDDIILEGNAPWLAVKKTSTRKSIDILVDCDHNIRLRRVARKLGISEPVAGAFLNTVERNTHERLCKHYSQQFIHFEKFADMLVHTHFSLPGVVAAGIVIQFKLAQQIAS